MCLLSIRTTFLFNAVCFLRLVKFIFIFCFDRRFFKDLYLSLSLDFMCHGNHKFNGKCVAAKVYLKLNNGRHIKGVP